MEDSWSGINADNGVSDSLLDYTNTERKQQFLKDCQKKEGKRKRRRKVLSIWRTNKSKYLYNPPYQTQTSFGGNSQQLNIITLNLTEHCFLFQNESLQKLETFHFLNRLPIQGFTSQVKKSMAQDQSKSLHIFPNCKY